MTDRPFMHLDLNVDYTKFVDGRMQVTIVAGPPDADDAYHYICSALDELDEYRAVTKRAGASPTTDERVITDAD